MNATIHRVIMGVGLGRPYRLARATYHNFRLNRTAKRIFSNPTIYLDALKRQDGGTSLIQMRDGLKFEIRRNHDDAAVLAEVFLDKDYAHGIPLPPDNIVIDIGGYIGDFAIYAVKHLGARKVFTIEPSPDNWALLTTNIRLNGLEGRIVPIQAAVTDGQPIKLDLGARNQARVSAYYGTNTLTEVPGVSLDIIRKQYELTEIHLLKLDCEGGEYEILATISDETLACVRNIVFEFHEIEGFASRLHAIKDRLVRSGFQLSQRGHLVSAVRPALFK